MLTRRTVLAGLSGMILGSAATNIGSNGLPITTSVYAADRMNRFEQPAGIHWEARKLDPNECAPVAYDGFWHNLNACGYGAFYSIIGMLAEKYGEPYSTFPFSMLTVNEGGIVGWGTICGALYGAAAAFALFWNREECTPLINDLFRWYESTSLPIYDPGPHAKGYTGYLPAKEPGSVLCHISVSNWCHTFGKKANSVELGERCARLTVDVAHKAIEIMNEKIEKGKSYKEKFILQSSVEKCSYCHAYGKKADIQKSAMDCTPCHSGNIHLGNKFLNHP